MNTGTANGAVPRAGRIGQRRFRARKKRSFIMLPKIVFKCVLEGGKTKKVFAAKTPNFGLDVFDNRVKPIKININHKF